MDKPSQIFNMDECGIGEDSATKRKVYGVRGEHTYHQKVTYFIVLIWFCIKTICIYIHTHYTVIITMHVYSLKMNVKDNSFVFHLKFCFTYSDYKHKWAHKCSYVLQRERQDHTHIFDF